MVWNWRYSFGEQPTEDWDARQPPYKGGEQTLTLTPETRILMVAAGGMADLKPGVVVSLTIEKDAAGEMGTKRITVDR